jgi:hypothetical protein
MLERDEATQRIERLKHVIQGIYSNIPKVSTEVEDSLQEHVMMISEVIQGFHVNIIDLEACQTPSTLLKEREKIEKTVVTTVESIKRMGEECAKLYEERKKVWIDLLENA